MAEIRAHYGHYSSSLVMASAKGFVTSSVVNLIVSQKKGPTDFGPNWRRQMQMSVQMYGST